MYIVYSAEDASKIGPDKLYGYPKPEAFVIVEISRIAERVRNFLAAEQNAKTEEPEPPVPETHGEAAD
jgi:hypothetical protein